MSCMFCGSKTGCNCDFITGGFRTHFLEAGSPASPCINPWVSIHSNPEPTETWLKNWESTIPCGTCVDVYKELKEQFPPDFTDTDSFWRWGWFVHNAVNQKLIDAGDTTKRIMSIEEARQVWNRPAPTDQA